MVTIETIRRWSDFDCARMRLSALVQSEARRAAKELKFEECVSSARQRRAYDLRANLTLCHQTGLPLKVLEELSRNPVFWNRRAPMALRFWHDALHLSLGADFSAEGELEVAMHHLARAKAKGLGPKTFEYALLRAITVGQVLYSEPTSRSLMHELDFVLDCAYHGLDDAIEIENAVLALEENGDRVKGMSQP
jgi:hypothetical protein